MTLTGALGGGAIFGAGFAFGSLGAGVAGFPFELGLLLLTAGFELFFGESLMD
jgi:hypothetical protein